MDTTKSKPFKKELQVKLTIDERLDYADKLSRGVQDLQSLEDAKAESTKDYAARIKAAEANLGNLSRILGNGHEYRFTECYWEFDWVTGQKRLFRNDIGQEIEQKPIGMEERQQQLDLEAKQEETKTVVHEVIIRDERAGQPGDVVDAEMITEGAKALPMRNDHDDHCPECGHHVLDESEQVACGLQDVEPCCCTVCFPVEQKAPKAKKGKGQK